MKNYIILIVLLSYSCVSRSSIEQEEIVKEIVVEKKRRPKPVLCDYHKMYHEEGNKIMDTIRVNGRLVDPIDDESSFRKMKFGFVEREGRIYKEARTHHPCFGENINIKYYQEFTDRVDLDSFKEYNDRFFTTKGRVYFWWVNSDGHIMNPIYDADPDTFKPFADICGGIDENGVFYGSPTYGRSNKLNVPIGSDFEFIAKEDNYWNSPSHYIIIDGKVYDVKHEIDRGYFCEINDTISVEEILKSKM